MYITILGENGPYPAAGGACSGYLVSTDDGNDHVLLDCGSGVLGRLNEVLPFDKLSGVVLSHLHYDHMSDMLPLMYQLDFSGRQSLRVVAPDEPIRARALLEGGRLDVFPVRDMKIGAMRLSFFQGRHPVLSYAVAIEADGAKFVYTGDTNEVDGLNLFADGAALLLADAGLAEADWSATKPHLSARRCGILAREAQAKQLCLTHLSPRNERSALLAEAQAEFPAAMLAEAGARIYL